MVILNWSMTRRFLKLPLRPFTPVFSFSVCAGLKEDSTAAGYKPARKPLTTKTAIMPKTNGLSVTALKPMLLSMNRLNPGSNRYTSPTEKMKDNVENKRDSPVNCQNIWCR